MDERKKDHKPSLKLKDSPKNLKRDSKVTWDVKKLEELERYKLENPVLKKIDEAKTPYEVYEVCIARF